MEDLVLTIQPVVVDVSCLNSRFKRKGSVYNGFGGGGEDDGGAGIGKMVVSRVDTYHHPVDAVLTMTRTSLIGLFLQPQH